MKTEILRVFEEYRFGKLSSAQFVSIAFQLIDETTLPRLLRICPPELMIALDAVADASPKTDAEWAKVKFIESSAGTKLDDDDAETALAVLRSRYRKGVELFRKHRGRE